MMTWRIFIVEVAQHRQDTCDEERVVIFEGSDIAFQGQMVENQNRGVEKQNENQQ